MRPGVDHLVVALAVGDVARRVRLLETLHARGRFLEQPDLLHRDLEVLDADRDTAARGVAEPELLQAVEEADGRGQPGVPVAFDARGKIAARFELLLNFIGDGLNLPHVAAAANDPADRVT